jgi:hypothetical protein
LEIYTPKIDRVCEEFAKSTGWLLEHFDWDKLSGTQWHRENRRTLGVSCEPPAGLKFILSSESQYSYSSTDKIEISIQASYFSGRLIKGEPREPHISIKNRYNKTKYIFLEHFTETDLADILREYFLVGLNSIMKDEWNRNLHRLKKPGMGSH